MLECTGSDAWTLAASAALVRAELAFWARQQPNAGAAPAEHRTLDARQPVAEPPARRLRECRAAGLSRCALDHLAQLDQMYPTELRALITARVRPADALPHYLERQPQDKAVVFFILKRRAQNLEV